MGAMCFWTSANSSWTTTLALFSSSSANRNPGVMVVVLLKLRKYGSKHFGFPITCTKNDSPARQVEVTRVETTEHGD
uniref:Putative secreted protein n=1 Tax=Anopheles marajoara TaxID=58244 RepID=A0A2M4CCH2_9DIPT